MAMKVIDLIKWLKTIPKDDQVGIDDGGLILQVVDNPDIYLEVGGLPKEE